MRRIPFVVVILVLASTSCAQLGGAVDELPTGAAEVSEQLNVPTFVPGPNPNFAVTLVDGRRREYCQGVLIAPNVVATAAHCIASCEAQNHWVRYRGESTTKTVRVQSTLVDEFTANTIRDFCGSCVGDPEWPCDYLPYVIATMDLKEETDQRREGQLNHDFSLMRLGGNLVPAGTRLPPLSIDGPQPQFQVSLGGTRLRPGEHTVSLVADRGTVFVSSPAGCEGDSGGPATQMVEGHRAVVGLISAVTYPDGGTCANATQTDFVRVSFPLVSAMLVAATGVTPLRMGRLVFPTGAP